jgi:hypothetical protein
MDKEEQIDSIINKIEVFSKQMIQSTQEIDRVFRSFQDVMVKPAKLLIDSANKNKEIFEALGKCQVGIAKVMESLNEQKITEAINKFVEDIKIAVEETDETIKEAHDILFSLGWWLYPEWSFVDLKHIVELNRLGKKQEIETEIVSYFGEEMLDKILNQWKNNKRLKGRYPILEDALWAHKQQKYTLSIPPFLSQIEGIINENSGKTGRISQRDCIKSLKMTLQNNYTAKLCFWCSNTLVIFIEQILRQEFEWGKPSKKGRNSILHGHYVNYADKIFSLKLILLIDFIQNVFD